MLDAARPFSESAVHNPIAHDSALKHVTGKATYIDDISEPKDLLHVYVAKSEHAHARIKKLDVEAVRKAPGVVAVLTAVDIPGVNDCSPILGDDPIFADGIVKFHGQVLFAVAAESLPKARDAAKLANVEYEVLEPVLTIADAIQHDSYVLESHVMRRRDSGLTLASAPHRLTGSINTGGQDHFYLEGQAAMAVPQEDNDVLVYSSTQHPSEVQHLIAKALGQADNSVTVEVRRMGGAFGGKETQAAQWAVIAALVCRATGRPAKLRLDRDDDMMVTGKRHDFRIDYDVGFDDDGRILAIEFEQWANCGCSADLSGAIADRAMFHADNGYYLDNVTITSHRCKTNTVSNTAFRGFGGPQGMVGIERVMDVIAYHLKKDPLTIRKRNLYGKRSRNITPYYMTVEDNVLPELMRELEKTSRYKKRRRQVKQFNKSSPVLKKGIALTPVKFGISFTTTHLNQAGALVHVYTDGSVHLNHGGTEMGQGLFVKVAQVVADEFQIDLDQVKITATNTSKVPNTSATAASSGSDINGKAAQAAAKTIKQRLINFAAKHYSIEKNKIEFVKNQVLVGDRVIKFKELVQQAYLNRIQLSATGFYATPKIHYDRETASGRPFLYFAYGVAVSEVTIDTLTGEYKVDRVDILHDVGQSLNPAIDLGQIEGGFIQGMGWLTMEELWWDEQGRLQTHAPSTYKIPVCSDLPETFKIQIWERGRNREATIRRSKAVGEPPFMLAVSVFSALSYAVSSVVDYQALPQLDAPATPERVLLAVEQLKQQHLSA